MPPMTRKKDSEKISEASISDIQKTRESMSFPVLLQSALESFFSFSSFVIVLYPAIRDAPLPRNSKMARTKKMAITQIKTIMFSCFKIQR